MDQWNRKERPEINPHTYNQLTCSKGGKNIQGRKDGLFSKCWQSWRVACKPMTLGYSHTIHRNKHKMAQTLKYETVYPTTPEREHWQNTQAK